MTVINSIADLRELARRRVPRAIFEYNSDKFNLTSTFGFIQGVVGTPRMPGVEANWRY